MQCLEAEKKQHAAESETVFKQNDEDMNGVAEEETKERDHQWTEKEPFEGCPRFYQTGNGSGTTNNKITSRERTGQ